MMKTRARVYYCRVLFAVCIISMLGLSAPWAAPVSDDRVTSERAKAFIGGKGPDVLVMSEHGFKTLSTNRLAVNRDSLIYDEDGREISIKDLKIPCEAYVEYRGSRGKEPELYRLEVRRYGENATSFFTQKQKPKPLPK